jgi:DNA-binding response OmpR family regulator
MTPRPRALDRPTVLVVDDEPKVARLIRHTLTADGFEVLHAPDGLAGVEMVETERPDIVLLDVMMPVTACRPASGSASFPTCR